MSQFKASLDWDLDTPNGPIASVPRELVRRSPESGPPLTPALAALVARLRTMDRLDAASLAQALSEAPLAFDDVSSFVRFDAETYVRSPIYRDERVELRLLCWRPGQSTSLHGHGDAACAFRILRGTATETVVGERDRVWAPGSVVIEDRPCVHQVQCSGGDPLLTLHAYSPPLPVDAPSPMEGRSIVIIGGGFSAVAVAYHLLHRGGADLRIHVVEKGPWLGRGIAYGVESDVFRLNVPASRMSIDPERPDDFVRFAGAQSDPHAFLGRAEYGRYVTTRLARALRESPGKMRLWRDEAVAVTDRDVVLRSGRRLTADAVVLATGLVPRIVEAPWHPRVVDAWDECALATLPRSGHVLVLGSGLSALDVLAFLDARAHAGKVTMVSPRGLLPLPHAPVFRPAPPLSLDDATHAANAPRALRPLVRWVRETIAAGIASGLPWQVAVDRMRPHVAHLYRALSSRDRARFVRHVRPYWDVCRHRAPLDAARRVRAWEEAGRLHRVAGRVTLDAHDDAIRAEIRERSGAVRAERFDAVVRCIGPALDIAEGATPLLASLLDAGLARRTARGLGIETDPRGCVVDARGHASSRIVAIGAVRRASDWETTSVPDIAAHALDVARWILGEPASAAPSMAAPPRANAETRPT